MTKYLPLRLKTVISCKGMKKAVFVQMLMCISLVTAAQTNKDQEKNNYLIPVDKEQERAIYQDDLSLFLYAVEKNRLLIPSNATFGVVFTPSLFCESSITYDTQRRLLMYTVVDDKKSIWGCVYDATTVVEDGIERTLTKAKNYKAPKMKTYSLTISYEASKHLVDLWAAAIGTARPSQSNQTILDGTGREFFIDGKFARTQRGSIKDGRIFQLLILIEDLRQAIKEGDSVHSERICQESVSLTKEFDHR